MGPHEGASGSHQPGNDISQAQGPFNDRGEFISHLNILPIAGGWSPDLFSLIGLVYVLLTLRRIGRPLNIFVLPLVGGGTPACPDAPVQRLCHQFPPLICVSDLMVLDDRLAGHLALFLLYIDQGVRIGKFIPFKDGPIELPVISGMPGMDARHSPALGRPIDAIEETGGGQQAPVFCLLGIGLICEEGIGVSDPVAVMSDGISCGGGIEIRLTGPPHHPQPPPEFS